MMAIITTVKIAVVQVKSQLPQEVAIHRLVEKGEEILIARDVQVVLVGRKKALTTLIANIVTIRNIGTLVSNKSPI